VHPDTLGRDRAETASPPATSCTGARGGPPMPGWVP
jgi:hypothetical protein